MKQTPLLTFAVIIFLLFFSCRKPNYDERTLDTRVYVYPGPYYPAYPGSYWIYTAYDQLSKAPYSFKSTVSPEYLPSSFKTISNTGDTISTATVYVPVVDYVLGRGCCVHIYGYNMIQLLRGDIYYLWPFFSESAGASFPSAKYKFSKVPWDDRTFFTVNPKKNKVRIGDILYDDVIALEGRISPSGPEGHVKVWKYYAKNIGLVGQYAVDTITGDTPTWSVLTSFHIQK